MRPVLPLLAGIALVAVTAAPAAVPPRLSADEQQRLAAGEVIRLAALPPDAPASAQGGTAMALVRAAPATVRGVLVDYPRRAG